MHHPGTVGLPKHWNVSTPETLHVDTYVNPDLLNRHPDLHAPIASLVQQFTEKVAFPTSQSWAVRVRDLVPYVLSSHPPSPLLAAIVQPLIPHPSPPTSTRYIFRGRPLAILNRLIDTHGVQSNVGLLNPLDRTQVPEMSLELEAHLAESFAHCTALDEVSKARNLCKGGPEHDHV